MTRRTIFLDNGIWNRLKKIAEVKGEKVSVIIRAALYEYLKRNEEK